ncbi:MAG: 50S ribosomal protein L15 [Thermoanaerobaculia bacterium]
MIENLKPKKGAVHKRKRVGRGPGSGHGKTATRGHNGFWSRSGSSMRANFEGGQMPLVRRIPKRGFTNIFRKEYSIVNLNKLNSFEKGSEVTPQILLEKGIIKELKAGVKILGTGELEKPLNIKAHAFSKSAREKIEKAGGKCEVI